MTGPGPPGPAQAPPDAEGCRVDVWLWRARLCKTRSDAALLADSGRIRLTREGGTKRLDKASRRVRIGDQLTFALGGRLVCVRVLAPGLRRGPPAEARKLYAAADVSPAPEAGASLARMGL